MEDNNNVPHEEALEKIKQLIFDPRLWSFFLAMIGLWIFCWSMWGGSITVNNSVPGSEQGLGVNPPKK